jgi:hypothetical protein
MLNTHAVRGRLDFVFWHGCGYRTPGVVPIDNVSSDGALAIVELAVRHVLEGFFPDAAESMQKAPPIIKFGPRAIRPKDAGATCDNCLPVVATTSRDLVGRFRTVQFC